MPPVPSTPLTNKTSTRSLRTPSAYATPSSKRLSTSSAASLSSTNTTSTSTNANANATEKLTRAGSGSSLLGTTHKKYKAPLSTESKRASKTSSFLSTSSSSSGGKLTPVPGTPTKSGGTTSRPRTPASPRKGAESPSLIASEMDVSNVDIEAVLVDYQTVEAGDTSFDADAAGEEEEEEGGGDKVMVSVRLRPTNSTAWQTTSTSISLLPTHSKSPSPTASNQQFTFDSILTGPANKPIYTTAARRHVRAAMEGYNAVIFAYGQTASGKTYTLAGDESEPGIVPRALRDVFGYIKSTKGREYLLRCSYLEIYNETIVDLLSPPSLASANPVQIQGSGNEIALVPLREEVVTSLEGVKAVLRRGEGNRRTASTDWNERSSRSHSVFRVVVESRERDSSSSTSISGGSTPVPPSGRHTPGLNGRQTPGGRHTPGLGGARLQARGGRSVRTSVLSLIDLAGSEKATSDKERTREGKYINTSLLTLGTVIGTLAENAAKGKTDHVPYRNSKLTRILQPSLSGNARISVICTINPEPGAVSESLSTLGFARRVRGVKLNAQKKEIEDTDALIERYRKEIEDLKRRLEEREREVDKPKSRRLSAREQHDETKVMGDLNARIKQLTKLILTSQTVDDKSDGDASRPSSPSKVDFDMSPYQLHQELLAARLQLDTQSNQILSLEAALTARPLLPPSASESEKDKLISEQAKTIRELEIVVRGYEENLGEPLRKVKEDVEREWGDKLDEERKRREEAERWAEEVVRGLEREKKARKQLEEERRALAAFVSKFDALGLGGLGTPTSKLNPPRPVPGGAAVAYSERGRISSSSAVFGASKVEEEDEHDVTPTSSPVAPSSHSSNSSSSSSMAAAMESPMRLDSAFSHQPSLLDEPAWDMNEGESFDSMMEVENAILPPPLPSQSVPVFGVKKIEGLGLGGEGKDVREREVLGDKENIAP